MTRVPRRILQPNMEPPCESRGETGGCIHRSVDGPGIWEVRTTSWAMQYPRKNVATRCPLGKHLHGTLKAPEPPPLLGLYPRPGVQRTPKSEKQHMARTPLDTLFIMRVNVSPPWAQDTQPTQRTTW